MGNTVMRFFAPTQATSQQAPVPLMPLQYMIYNARVKINLPHQGESWFFIDPKYTVQQFLHEVQAEDKDSITSLEILRGSGKDDGRIQNVE